MQKLAHGFLLSEFIDHGYRIGRYRLKHFRRGSSTSSVDDSFSRFMLSNELEIEDVYDRIPDIEISLQPAGFVL
ncbi:hypothetical protein [Agrobacterium tumefaciens]|uniref:hypothetical protein n=1 Tax=Agrobacterium tumefaciens TaxID=358 RepID=UPI00287E880F|nr:hypothetical protein [Agrobacterium tumefaciens]MDS7594636.1 hypothetical protein [Agrobacterium tumefaciens]